MSQYKTQFEQYGFPARLATVRTAWTENMPLEILQAQQKADYERSLKVFLLLEARFNAIDPELYPINIWQEIVNHLNSINNFTDKFKQDNNPTHIQNVNERLDLILTKFSMSEKAEEHLSEVVERLTSTVGIQLKDIAGKRAEFEGEIKLLSQKISALKSKSAQTDQTIQAQSQRLDVAIAEHQKQFSDAQDKRLQNFATIQEEQVKKVAQLVEEAKLVFDDAGKTFSEEHKATLKEAETDAEEALKCVRDLEEKTKRIFNVVGNIATSGDYKNIADKERNTANLLRIFSSALMLSMAIIAGIIFWHSLSHPEVDFKLFAFRLSTTFIIALPAFYLAQESTKHRQRENRNRRLHLELAAIDAYLELLPDSEKQKIKGDLTVKFFGQSDIQNKDESISQHQFFNLISDTLKNLSKGNN